MTVRAEIVILSAAKDLSSVPVFWEDASLTLSMTMTEGPVLVIPSEVEGSEM